MKGIWNRSLSLVTSRSLSLRTGRSLGPVTGPEKHTSREREQLAGRFGGILGDSGSPTPGPNCEGRTSRTRRGSYLTPPEKHTSHEREQLGGQFRGIFGDNWSPTAGPTCEERTSRTRRGSYLAPPEESTSGEREELSGKRIFGDSLASHQPIDAPAKNAHQERKDECTCPHLRSTHIKSVNTRGKLQRWNHPEIVED